MSGCMETDKPLVSIVIPVYCAEQYISLCVESLVRQSYKNIEIILIDDGSPDACGSICDAFSDSDSRITVIHQKNEGVSSARNAGISIANGAFITFVDADDWVEPDFIEYLLQILVKSNADIAIAVQSGKLQKNEIKYYDQESALRCMLYQKIFDTSPWSKLYRIEIVKEMPFPKDMFFEDLAIVCQWIGEAQKIVVGNHRIYHYRITPGSTMNGNDATRLIDELAAADMMYEYIYRKYPAVLSAARCRKFSAYCQVLLKLPKHGYKNESAKAWHYLKNNRKAVLCDSDARTKNRIAAAISYFGKDVLRLLWHLGK